MAATLEAFWPRLTTVQSAADTVRNAAAYAYLVAAVTGTLATYAMFYGAVWGFDGWAVGDALFLALVGWRISKFSQPWAIVGVTYWVVNMASKLSTPQLGLRPVGFISILILLGFINGVRGIRAYNSLSKQRDADNESPRLSKSFRSAVLTFVAVTVAVAALAIGWIASLEVDDGVSETSSSSDSPSSDSPGRRAVDLLPQLRTISLSRPEYAAFAGLPSEALQDPWFKSTLGAAVSLTLGDSEATSWVSRLEVVAAGNEIIEVPGLGDVVLVSGCQPHFCSDHRLYIVYDPSRHVLFGMAILGEARWQVFGTADIDAHAVALIAYALDEARLDLPMPGLTTDADGNYVWDKSRAEEDRLTFPLSDPARQAVARVLSTIGLDGLPVEPSAGAPVDVPNDLFMDDDGKFRVGTKDGPIWNPGMR